MIITSVYKRAILSCLAAAFSLLVVSPAIAQETFEPTQQVGVPQPAPWDIVVRHKGALIQSVLNNQKGQEEGVFSLVSGKDMVARFFYNTSDGKDRDGTVALCVDSEVPKCPQDKLFKATGKVYADNHRFTVQERREAKNSLNVFITGAKANALLTSGKHKFYAVVAVGEETFTDSLTGAFQDSARLNIFVAPYTLNKQAPDKDLLTHAGDLVKSVYPIDEENVTVTAIADNDFDAGGRNEFTRADFDKLKKVFNDRILVNDKTVKEVYKQAPEANNIVLGVVTSAANDAPFGKDDGVSILGYTLGFQQPPRVAVTMDRTPKGDPTIKRTNKLLIASTSAHEIGHLFGFGDEYTKGSSQILNPPHSKDQDATGTAAGYYILEKEMAFDVSGVRKTLFQLDNKKAPPDISAVFVALNNEALPVPDPPDPIAEGAIYGYMGGTGRAAVDKGLGALLEGGSDVRSWTRELNYEYLYTKLKKADNLSGPAANPSPRDVIHISGTVGLDDSSAFNLFLAASTDADFTDPSGSQYSIQLWDASNQILKEVYFDLSFTEHLIFDGNEATDVVPFDMVIDLPSQTAYVVLLHNGKALNTYAMVPKTPTLSVVSAQLSGGTLTVNWTASDPNPLEYIVIYSPDGVDLYAFATDITDTSASVSLGDYPPPVANAQACVLANNGSHSVEQCLLISQ